MITDDIKSSGGSMAAIFIGGVFLAVVGVAEFIIHRSFLLVAVYSVASLLTYLVYAIDKNAARKGAWRIPEAQLHLLALIGGWPGAMLAQQTLRHKSQKASFRFVFWITVILNCAGTAWLLSPEGIGRLNALGDALLKSRWRGDVLIACGQRDRFPLRGEAFLHIIESE
jgi:uncharacterized membrane protein YsdA (DUF1294 family)